MYYENPDQRIYECHTAKSAYLLHIDHRDRLTWMYWGSRPTPGKGPIIKGLQPPKLMNWMSQETFKSFDEVAAYGDESLQEPAISLEIPQLPTGAGEARHFPVRDARLRFKSYRIGSPSAIFAGAPAHGRPVEKSGGKWMIFTLENPAYPVEVELCLRAISEFDIIERYLVISNKGDQPIRINHAWSASLQLPFGKYCATHLCGCWGAEFTRERHALPVGSTHYESRSINTGLKHQPTVFLQKDGKANRVAGETWGAQLAWSGNWRIHLEACHDYSLHCHLGEHPVDSARELGPGEVLATPRTITGFSGDGEEGLRRQFQEYHMAYTIPQSREIRPVLYNSWEATYFNLSEENQKALARKAAAIGVELFVVDDGWFGDRRNDRAGLGDWSVSKEVFPNGLGPLIQEVHHLGMKFGIWFEPEMVNPDSDLYRAHPDWVLHFPGAPRMEGRNQLLLDFGNPDVVRNIKDQMMAFLDENPVDFIKWDMNRSVNGCGSVAGRQIWRRHVEGVYSIMDSLMAKFPDLTIQSCSSGGGRTDAGMFQRARQIWTSDNTDALDRIAIQDGYALTFPAAGMECWVTHEKNHQTSRILSLPLRFTSAMRGVLGIGSHLNELSDQELAEYAEWITFYKSVRHLVQGGILHRAALPEEDQGLSVWQFTAKDASEAYVNAVIREHKLGTQTPYYRLANLQPKATYAIHNFKGEVVLKATGLELMSFGLSGNDSGEALATQQGSCWNYYLKRI
jgi:alpha-galactosidase